MNKTRFLRPVENIAFNGQDMLNGLFNVIHPSLVSSINLLHGDRKGVMRMTLKTVDALMELDQKLESKKVLINGVRMAAVGEYGQFLKVTLMDVPEYLTNLDIERELREYGTVAYVKREYIDYRGHKIENETRNVLFSTFHQDIPQRIFIDGNPIFVLYKSPLRSRTNEDVSGRAYIGSRIPSRQTATVTHVPSGEHEVMEHERTLPRSSSRVAGRAPSPMVTPETEKLPEMRNSHPRHVMATPESHRRNVQIVNAKGPADPARYGPTHSSVEAQVQTEGFKRHDSYDNGGQSWVSGSTSVQEGGHTHFTNVRRYTIANENTSLVDDVEKGFGHQRSSGGETKI